MKTLRVLSIYGLEDSLHKVAGGQWRDWNPIEKYAHRLPGGNGRFARHFLTILFQRWTQNIEVAFEENLLVVDEMLVEQSAVRDSQPIAHEEVDVLPLLQVSCR